MTSDRLRDVALWLLIVAAGVFLIERLFVVLTFFANPLLLFGLSWLVSLILQPPVRRLTGLSIPIPKALQPAARHATEWHMPASLAVPLVYLIAFTILTFLIFALVPAIGPQIIRLGETTPTLVAALASTIQNFEERLRGFGFRGDLSAVVQPEAIAQQVGAIGTTLVQQSLGIASSIATLLFSAFLILILSFYMTIDGARIGARLIELMPTQMRDEARLLLDMVDRVFGGFLRAQILQSLIYGAITAVVMATLGIGDIALASVLASILIVIPLVGAIIALIPPIVFALATAPDQTILLVVLLFVAQQILFNLIMPRLLGESVGLHPLLVFAAMLIGGTVAGGWGLLFGIPIAGVAASILQFIYQRTSRESYAGVIER
ncbi:MAG: AI-2E family transporter [Roseiflexaceae bacterium]